MNHILSSFFNRWIIGNFIPFSILALGILLILFIFRYRFSSQIRYTLLSLVFIRLLLPGSIPVPFLPETGTSILSGFSGVSRAEERPADSVIREIYPSTDSPGDQDYVPPEPVQSFRAHRESSGISSLVHRLPAVYFGVCLLLAAFCCGWALRFRLRTRDLTIREAESIKRLIQKVSRELGFHGHIRLKILPVGSIPLSGGLSGTIYLPEEFFSPHPESPFASDHNREMVLLHEMAHLKNGDHLLNLALLLL